MRGLAQILVLLWLSLVLAPACLAGDGGKAWRVVRVAPELHLRFEDRGERAPCSILGAAPEAAAVECWSTYVDRAISKGAKPLEGQIELACLPEWEITQPGEDGCPMDVAHCARPEAGLFTSVGSDLPIATNIDATWEASAAMAREYTAFQALRNGQALNPHRPSISGLALSQGMLVLHHAHAIESVRRRLEASDCATEHLEPYFELASWVTEELGGSDVPRVLESYPPAGREWSWRFRRIQLEVVGRAEGIRPDGPWSGYCKQALEAESRVGQLDADFNAWCGYAYERLDKLDVARKHWKLARRSPHHPEASSYAREHQRDAPESRDDGVETAAIDPREDGGGQ